MFEYSDVLGEIYVYAWIQGPVLLAWMAGIVWAVLTWKRNPRKSLLTTLVLVTFLLRVPLWPVLNRYLLGQPFGNMSPDEIARYFKLVDFGLCLLEAVLWLLLFAAIFLVDRQPPAPRGPDGELLPPDLHPERARPS